MEDELIQLQGHLTEYRAMLHALRTDDVPDDEQAVVIGMLESEIDELEAAIAEVIAAIGEANSSHDPSLDSAEPPASRPPAPPAGTGAVVAAAGRSVPPGGVDPQAVTSGLELDHAHTPGPADLSHNMITLDDAPAGPPLELDPTATGSGQLMSYGEVDLPPGDPNMSLDLLAEGEAIPESRWPPQNFGELTGMEVGTHHRTGMDFNMLHPAEISNGLRVRRDAGGITTEVRFRISRENAQSTQSSSRRFRPDDSTAGPQSVHGDYTHTGQNRGHLAAREAFALDERFVDPEFHEHHAELQRMVEQDADMTTNVNPQDPHFNQHGAWRQAEREANALAVQHGEIEVQIEPVLAPDPPRLPNGEPIPEGYIRREFTADGQLLREGYYQNSASATGPLPVGQAPYAPASQGGGSSQPAAAPPATPEADAPRMSQMPDAPETNAAGMTRMPDGDFMPDAPISGGAVPDVPPTGGASMMSRAGQVVGLAGDGLSILGCAASGYQVGTGMVEISEGRTAHGVVDIAEGGTNLALEIGTAQAVRSGAVTLVAEGGTATMGTTLVTGGAAIAAGGAWAWAYEDIRRALDGRPTMTDEAIEMWSEEGLGLLTQLPPAAELPGAIWDWMTGPPIPDEPRATQRGLPPAGD